MKSHSYPGPEVTGFALRGSRIKVLSVMTVVKR